MCRALKQGVSREATLGYLRRAVKTAKKMGLINFPETNMVSRRDAMLKGKPTNQ